jgi:hypothetical protein
MKFGYIKFENKWKQVTNININLSEEKRRQKKKKEI